MEVNVDQKCEIPMTEMVLIRLVYRPQLQLVYLVTGMKNPNFSKNKYSLFF